MDCKQQIVLYNRLMQVCHVRCFGSIFCELRVLGLCSSVLFRNSQKAYMVGL